VLARIKRLAPYLLLGPISGPLVAGVVHNFRNGRPVLGSMYAVLLAECLYLVPVLSAKFLPVLIHYG
jgi:hypothetical protein